LGRLELAGAETVLDAGCGSGRVTEAILERVPRGRVIALDESASMMVAARERLARHVDGSREAGETPSVEIVQGDLPGPRFAQPVDAVFSTATFHWIKDHELLFARLRAALRPGGRLVAQCGGEGNIDKLRAKALEVAAREPYGRHFEDFEPPWNYAGAEVTRERLLAAGFTSAGGWLGAGP